MKILIISLSVVLISLTASRAQNIEAYRRCVKQFYNFLYTQEKVSVKNFSSIFSSAEANDEAEFLAGKHIHGKSAQIKKENRLQLSEHIQKNSDTIRSSILNEVRKYKERLTLNLSYDSLISKIDSAKAYNEGYQFSNLMELELASDYSIFFEFGDFPYKIEYLWLGNGESLGSVIFGDQSEKLLRPGIIKDKDGYSYLRESSNSKGRIIGRVLNGELFYYTPVGGEDWYPIYKLDGKLFLGYMHKSRIEKYANFSPKLKKKILKIRSGC